MRRRLLVSAAALVLCAAIVVAFLLNPATVAPARVGGLELLQDTSFEQPATLGTWNVRAGDGASAESTFSVRDSPQARDLKRVGALTNGTISQEVLLTPVRGRAYRFSVWVRSLVTEPAPNGSIVAQTACVEGDEVATTPFVAKPEWTEVSATVQPIDGERCTMRATISMPAGSIELDDASYLDAGLVNPSFELGGGRESWTVDRSASVAAAGEGAVDGVRSLRVSATASGSGVRQDTPVDPSTQPLLATASVLVRASGDPIAVRLEFREPCSDVVHRADTMTTPSWQRLVVRQPRLPGDTFPPSLVKVDGVPCAGQVAIVALGPGSFEIDGAAFSSSSYWPPSGDPSYRRAVKRRDGGLSPQVVAGDDAG